MRETPLPVVPRPFHDEAFGSWFGRLARRYRLGVDELAVQLDVSIDFGSACSRWLLAAAPAGASLRRLSALCRLPQEVVVGTPSSTAASDIFRFCERCFFLNPVDVTELYWKASWLMAPAKCCDVHGCELDFVRGSTLSCQRNLRSLERYISKRRRERAEKLWRLSDFQRFCRDQSLCSSAFTGHQ